MNFVTRLIRSEIIFYSLLSLPALWPLYPFFTANYTVLADPTKYLLHHFGFWACLLLVTVLSFTPLKVLFPKLFFITALNSQRRAVGVASFVYACIHLGFQFLHESGWPTLVHDLRKPFILIGVLAFLILTLLAATSFNAAVRWLGARTWKSMHRFAYLAAFLVAIHQALGRKIFPKQVIWIFLPLLILEIVRLIYRYKKKTVSAVVLS